MGDQVIVRGIWTDEANAEAEQLMNSKITALKITGETGKATSKEVFDAFYELTKEIDKPKPVKLTSNETEEMLNLTPRMITLPLLVNLFADTSSFVNGERSTKVKKSRFNTWDQITVPANYFYKGQPTLNTTIGRFITNKFLLEGAGVISETGYKNETLGKSGLNKLNERVATLLAEDKITKQQFDEYSDRRDMLGYWCTGPLTHSISRRMLGPLAEVEKKKAQLIKKHQKELDAGNVDVMKDIEKELIAYAQEILKGDPGMDLYDSGDLDFKNNYKNNSIIKGPVFNNITNKFDFIPNSYMNGIDVKNMPAYANSILSSQYPASIATAEAGYLGKKLLALMQMAEIGPEGSDCHTKQLIPLFIDNHNKKQVIYTWIKDGDKEILLTPDNIDNYVNKTVMMRTPMTCIDDKICSKCAGQLFYMLGVKHAGLFTAQISYSDLNLGLKAKHDSTVNLYKLNPDSIIHDL